MQTRNKKNKQKQPSGTSNKPEVLNLKILSPLDIEKENLLKRITVLEAKNDRQNERLKLTDKYIQKLKEEVDFWNKEVLFCNKHMSELSGLMAWQAAFINHILFNSPMPDPKKYHYSNKNN